MIARLDINFVHTKVDEAVKTHVNKRIGRLDRYISRVARHSAHAEVMLKQEKASDKRTSTCEVTLHLPHEVINVSETSINFYTAVDVAELKLKHAIRKYKDLHTGGTLSRRLASRFSKKTDA